MFNPAGMTTHPVTGEKGWLMSSGFATKGEGGDDSGQAYNYFDFISENDPWGHYEKGKKGRTFNYSLADITKSKKNIEGKERISDLDKFYKKGRRSS